MVIQLEDCEDGLDFMDKYITSNISDLETDDPVRIYIEKSMIHKCSASVNGCLNADGICRRGYQNHEVRLANSIDDKGYPVYKRLAEEDMNVVPTNAELINAWQRHINVEYCGSTYTILYLSLQISVQRL